MPAATGPAPSGEMAPQDSPVRRPLRNVDDLTAIGGTYADDAPTDFSWVATDEPHRSRRKAILAAHPEVKTLFGPEPLTAPITLALTVTCLFVATLAPTYFSSIPVFLVTAYVIGGTLVNSLFLAIHEITHFLAFRTVRWNLWLAYVANFPIVIPYAVTFKGYHAEHHQYQGHDMVDTDIPTPIEAKVLSKLGIVGKVIFLAFQILFYALRPPLTRPIPKSPCLHSSRAIQVGFDLLFVTACYFLLPSATTLAAATPAVSAASILSAHASAAATAVNATAAGLAPSAAAAPFVWGGAHDLMWWVVTLGGRTPWAETISVRLVSALLPLLWLLLGVVFAGMLHPISGHFIAEHFVFVPGHETYSYYGVLNWLAFNVGYHNEHHDFPNVPWSRLPALRRMAREFYDPLPSHTSWPGVLWKFLSRKSVGCYSRVKRCPLSGAPIAEKAKGE
eukprot:TRINITY_DN56114_c0_g1_i1.p1 TRINITY_DN56114_c0_g1~~TRINITY_DN56114_c0_g1_i1.p1  ORF type:complete len:448 (+),score=93.06 TRINITY_DN56114_c0_g1_i1:93-1436(+)